MSTGKTRVMVGRCRSLLDVGIYVGGLCVCFCGLLVVDSGLQEWASFVTAGPITARAQWLCRGVPFAVGWVTIVHLAGPVEGCQSDHRAREEWTTSDNSRNRKSMQNKKIRRFVTAR